MSDRGEAIPVGDAVAGEALANIEELRRYWTTGPGGARIGWGGKNDLTKCHRLVSRATRHDPTMTDDAVWGFCNNLHKRRFGVPNDPND